MSRRPPIISAAALCAALAAQVSPAALARTGAARSSLGTCPAADVVAWLDPNGSGAAGSIFYTVNLTNLSGRACSLSSYPRVAAVDLAGRQVGRSSRAYPSPTPNVTLGEGASASFLVDITDVADFPASACRPVEAAGLRVFLPHQSASKLVPYPFKACSNTSTRYLSARAIQRG
jgi:hypothetical protein